MKVFIDSSVIIFGLEKKHSNSARILDALIGNEFVAVINEKVIIEVKRYFKKRRGRQMAYLVESLLRKHSVVIPEERFAGHMDLARKEIKEKDAEHLATARALNIGIIVAFDRDFLSIPEYWTPKEFMTELGKQSAVTIY